MAKKATPPETEISEIDGVPTAKALVRMGLARTVNGGIRVTDEGHALMGQKLNENALRRLARGEGEWRRPPSRTDLGGNH